MGFRQFDTFCSVQQGTAYTGTYDYAYVYATTCNDKHDTDNCHDYQENNCHDQSNCPQIK